MTTMTTSPEALPFDDHPIIDSTLANGIPGNLHHMVIVGIVVGSKITPACQFSYLEVKAIFEQYDDVDVVVYHHRNHLGASAPPAIQIACLLAKSIQLKCKNYLNIGTVSAKAVKFLGNIGISHGTPGVTRSGMAWAITTYNGEVMSTLPPTISYMPGTRQIFTCGKILVYVCFVHQSHMCRICLRSHTGGGPECHYCMLTHLSPCDDRSLPQLPQSP